MFFFGIYAVVLNSGSSSSKVWLFLAARSISVTHYIVPPRKYHPKTARIIKARVQLQTTLRFQKEAISKEAWKPENVTLRKIRLFPLSNFDPPLNLLKCKMVNSISRRSIFGWNIYSLFGKYYRNQEIYHQQKATWKYHSLHRVTSKIIIITLLAHISLSQKHITSHKIAVWHMDLYKNTRQKGLVVVMIAESIEDHLLLMVERGEKDDLGHHHLL